MKTYKFSVLTVLVCCFFSSNQAFSGVPARLICPVGEGACKMRAGAADSTDSTTVVSKMTSEALRPIVEPLIPAQVPPAGSYCGRVALYTDTNTVTERVQCSGKNVYGPVNTRVWNPPVAAYCTGGEQETCYPAVDGYFATVAVLTPDCPTGYWLTTTGSSGPYQYYSCIKS